MKAPDGGRGMRRLACGAWKFTFKGERRQAAGKCSMTGFNVLNGPVVRNMLTMYVSGSRYLLLLLMAAYTYLNFRCFRADSEQKIRICGWQKGLMFLLHFVAYSVIGLRAGDPAVAVLYGLQVLFFLCYMFLYRRFYPECSRLLVNNVCMFLCIGFIMLARLDFEKAARQFLIAAASAAAVWLVPRLIVKVRNLARLAWLYGVCGLGLLLLVWLTGDTSFGARLSIAVRGFSFQPSEFVKILFVLFAASVYARPVRVKQVIAATAAAALHVLVLVLSRDLGGALIFFITYLFMMYAATSDWRLLGLGLLGGGGAAVAAYGMFSHVRDRVLVWLDPWSDIDDKGYQITQSLFAIGTGGWFGLGLGGGMPKKIPVVEKDFIFSAISEEMGALFALCLLLLCLGCFLQFLLIAGRSRDPFRKLTAFGLGTLYIVQVFLAVGGAVKFIPSTGVTLPFISYGGSSLLSTFLLFGILQGIYIAEGGPRETEEGAANAGEEAGAENAKEEASREQGRPRNGKAGYGGKTPGTVRAASSLPTSDREVKMNRNMRFLAFPVIIAFAGIILYVGWFLAVRSEEVIHNPYNARFGSIAADLKERSRTFVGFFPNRNGSG